MTKPVTSRSELLDTAYGIASAHGIAALSIRKLADESGVAVGTVYRYFPAKEDLTVAVTERYFELAFFDEFCRPAPNENFLAYCRRLYTSVDETIAAFRRRWLVGADSLPEVEKAAARMRESQRLGHVERGLAEVFARDPGIDRGSLGNGVDGPAVARFVLENVLASVRRGDTGCDVLFYLLERALYGTEGTQGQTADADNSR